MRTGVVGKENLEVIGLWIGKKVGKSSDHGNIMKKTNLVVVENQANKYSLAVAEISSGFLSQWIAWIEPGIKILNMTVDIGWVIGKTDSKFLFWICYSWG